MTTEKRFDEALRASKGEFLLLLFGLREEVEEGGTREASDAIGDARREEEEEEAAFLAKGTAQVA